MRDRRWRLGAGGREGAARIGRRRAAGRITDLEAHELNWLLRWPAHLALILDGTAVVADDERFTANDHARLGRWLRSALLRSRPEPPRLHHATWFSADAMTYRAGLRPGDHFRAWISLPALERGKPVRVPLAGDGIDHLAEGRTLRVSVERDTHGRKRVVVRYAVEIQITARTGTARAGADKGIATALTITGSDDRAATSHGTAYGPTLTAISDQMRQPNRGRVWAEQKTAASAGDHDKARQMRHRNLGNVKRERRQRKAEARLRQLHNGAIKDALRTHPDVTDLAVEDLGFVTTTDRGSRENRRLARWAKGQFQRDLERLSEADGVRLKVVSAAYSSQCCPACSWTERANRQGQQFRCRACGYAGSSDAVAASNLRARISDPEIGRFTPFAVVKQILLRRAADRAEALGLTTEDHGAAPGMTTARHEAECPSSSAA